jgi:predicted transcriptional regulator
MKRKISVRISEELAARLDAAAERPDVTKSAIVEVALERFLDGDHATVDDGDHERVDKAALSRRLNWMSRQLEQLDRDLRVVSETASLHARYHLTVSPPLPAAQQQVACLLGSERFEVFAAQVGRRVHLGTPLMRETMERLSETSPELFAHDIEEGVPLGATFIDREPDVAAPSVDDKEPELAAAAAEGGSNGGFPEESSKRSR